jgi:putative DNA primase/helicase
MDKLAEMALAYAARGLMVFPLGIGSKVPAIPREKGGHGLNDATTDADTIRRWWRDWPGSNIGIRTGEIANFWMLDIDVHHDGHLTLALLEEQHGALPPTIEVSTPRGGRHLWFAWPAGGPEIRNSVNRVGKGVDARGNGGQAIAPPSTIPGTPGYRWVRNGIKTFAQAPDWLIALTQPPPPPPRPAVVAPPKDLTRYIASAVDDELRRVECAGDGTRNATLNNAAFNIAQFVAAGALPEGWARQQLEARAVGIGLTAFEARGTINSAFRAGLQHPRELPR